ncbi:glycoside hydrolase domain-containing protein [Bacillus sp. FJAT-45350]|uniref:glycoside hydrolase domain-containing protein n=1 Tax=Bacillus sp. FJAT-45350 TaxID=2011014 RepID=UPI000BB8C514|nr:glycoside hydrolase domain-containing protein [Bacillus sp. FJAT-45350]
MPRTLWGVDSAAAVSEDLYNCVIENFGKPEYWGRYLTTVPNVSDGITSDEVARLRGNGIRILPIYNVFREAVGYRQGKITANNSVFQARRLGIPTGSVIFANVEHFFNVDEGWIRGWVDAFYPSGYLPGFYHDPVQGNFSSAFCEAVENNEQVRIQSILWSAEPEPGTTSKQNRPRRFAPASVQCEANVWGWQYGRDAEQCPIDTNLITQQMYDVLW